jgi:beta-mannanase
VHPQFPSEAARDILLPPGSNTVWHGVYLPSGRTISSSAITSFESNANKRIGVFLYYVGWYQNAWADVQRQINVLEPMGIKIHVVWEPKLKNGGDPLAAILSGSQNAIIDDFATKAASYGKPFFLRFAHEMNGNWYDWSGAKTGQNPQKYIDAWRYVWNRFQAKGATNAIWVWSPNADSVPNEPWNNLNNYYPGDTYVDWVGLDFYGLMWNCTTPEEYINRSNFYTNYDHKPIMVAETAAADCSNYYCGTAYTKNQWINDLFAMMNARTAIKAFFWFEDNKEADWRIISCPNPQARDAYRTSVGASRYVTR